MQSKRFQVYFKILALLGDFVILYASFYLAYWIRFNSGLMTADKGIPSLTLYTQAFGIITFICLLVFKFSALYTLEDNFRLEEFPAILSAVTISAIIVMAITFLYRQFTFSRIVIFLGWFISIVLVSIWRAGFSGFRRSVKHKIKEENRVLIIGAGRLAREIYQIAQQDQHAGYQIVGLINFPKVDRKDWAEFKGVEILESVDNLREVIGRLGVREIIMTKLPEASSQMLNIITECEKMQVEFKIIPDILELITTRSNLDRFLGLPVLSVKHIQLAGLNTFIKRILDILVSLFILLVIAIPMAIIALVIKLDSRGPVFYRQERMGYKGKKFKFMKFRSMSADADDRLKDIIHLNERQGPVFKMKNDPRITKIGKYLRKYSLDELPQFINVLKGDMSIVGPRPQVLWEAAYYDEWAKRRLLVLPGITGLWQVSGRSNLSYEEMIRLDIYYIENWSLWLDVDIMLQTIPTIVFSKGAY
jgi:exopolysaccharide biosynthesis polyprenyl glycosylphosphotransferase